MTYLISSLVVVWLCGLLFIAGQYLNNVRLVLNNILPDARSAEPQPSQPHWSRETAVTALDAVFVGPVLGLGILLARYFFSLGRFEGCRITNIDPARLTVLGRAHLERAIRHERIMFAWIGAGCIILVWAAFYFDL